MSCGREETRIPAPLNPPLRTTTAVCPAGYVAAPDGSRTEVRMHVEVVILDDVFLEFFILEK